MSTRDNLPCIHCEGIKEDHHEYTPARVPEGCICNTDDWGNLGSIPKVCAKFTPMARPESNLCAKCEHEEPCHVAAKGGGK